jgi:hypothetical protein
MGSTAIEPRPKQTTDFSERSAVLGLIVTYAGHIDDVCAMTWRLAPLMSSN